MILPDSAEISPNSMRFRQIRSKSHQIYLNYCRNLDFLVENWKIFPRIWSFLPKFGKFRQNLGFSPDGLGFSNFEGRETKTDPPLTTGVVGSTDVGSNPIDYFGWVRSSNGFGQP